MANEKLIWHRELLELIRDARSTKNSDRIVLSALALRADPRKHHSCYPGQALLVADTQLDLKTIRRALKRLDAAKLIARKKRFNDSDLYFINVVLLQRQAAANKINKEDPECPFDEPTPEQAKQLDADEEKVTFDDGPATDPAHNKDSAEPEPSPVRAAIQALEYVSEKMSAKQADAMARSLVKSHAEDDVLKAIASLETYALIEAYKAGNPHGYLRKCLNTALAGLENPEPAPQNIESCTEDEGSESSVHEALYDPDEMRAMIQAIVDDDTPSENRWAIPTFWDDAAVARAGADIAELSGGMIKVRGPFAINWDDGYFDDTHDRALVNRYMVLLKAGSATVEGEMTLKAHG